MEAAAASSPTSTGGAGLAPQGDARHRCRGAEALNGTPGPGDEEGEEI